MSMPTFPEDGLSITQEQAFNMLLGSIAMEEMALSHILNAEGEKLQYFLGTLPGGTCPCVTPDQLLELNRSVSHLLDQVMQNQMLLKGKMEHVLEAKSQWCRPDCRCPDCKCPDCRCPDCGEDCCQTPPSDIRSPKKTGTFHIPKCTCWKKGHNLAWTECVGDGTAQEREIIYIRDCAPHLIHYELEILTPRPCFVTFGIKTLINHGYHKILAASAYADIPGESIHMAGSLLLPVTPCSWQCPCPVMLTLLGPENVCVQGGELRLHCLSA